MLVLFYAAVSACICPVVENKVNVVLYGHMNINVSVGFLYIVLLRSKIDILVLSL